MAAEFTVCYKASNSWDMVAELCHRLLIMDGIDRQLKMFWDNKSAMLYSNNNRSSTKSKHIDIKFLVVKERVQSGQVFIEHIGTNSMVVDSLTKRFP